MPRLSSPPLASPLLPPVPPAPIDFTSPSVKSSEPKTPLTIKAAPELQNSLQLPPLIISLLQDPSAANGKTSLLSTFGAENTSKNTDITAALFGDSSNNDSTFASLLSGGADTSGGFTAALEAKYKAQPLQQAVNAEILAATETQTQNSTVQSLLSSLHTGANAYANIAKQTAKPGETQSLIA